MKSIAPLLTLYKKIVMLGSVNAVIGWDQETYMPSGSIEFRAQQTAFLSELSHSILSGKDFRNALSPLIDFATETINPAITDPIHQRMITEAHRDWKFAVSVPSSLVSELAETTSLAQHEWQHARKTNDFNRFKPVLDRVIRLTHQKIDYIGFAENPYDALLDPFEPRMTVRKLDPIFAELRIVTQTALTKMSSVAHPPLPLQEFDLARQRWLSDDLLHRMGFDLSRGRLDVSTHPFSIAFHPTDSRITTRFSARDLMESLSSTMHEAGHGLYEQGLPLRYFGTPLGSSMSLGIHESQSRLWENMVGKSPEFWEGYFPILCGQFPELKAIDWTTFYQFVNHVAPTLIRVESDEITYNLHILIRYELEQLLFSNTISTGDLPDAWNQKMEDYLGIRPDSNANGVLQDVHWSIGAFGYFPTYSLGNLYAAQFYEAAQRDIPSLSDQIRGLDFLPLRDWLKTNIHQVGRSQTPDELVETVTGEPLSIHAFERYLGRKFKI